MNGNQISVDILSCLSVCRVGLVVLSSNYGNNVVVAFKDV